MFQYVHHVHYVVHDRDAMVDYLEKTFGMKPDHLSEDHRHGKEAHYDIGQTQIQIAEPLDSNSGQGKFLASQGPGVYHVAWAVDDIENVAKELAAKGSKMRGEGGFKKTSRGFPTINIDPVSSHGLWFQLCASEHHTPKKQTMFKYVHHVHYAVQNRDALVEYLERTFGMKPDELIFHKDSNQNEAVYNVGMTQIQITEALDWRNNPTSRQGRHVAKHGAGVWHVAWAVDNVQELAQELIATGTKLRDKETFKDRPARPAGDLTGPRGYPTINIDPASSHGVLFQLVEGRPAGA